MNITCKHSASSYGIPVILDDDGTVMDYPDGITQALRRLGWSRRDLAAKTGYSVRTIEKFFQDRPVTAELLNVLAVALEELEEVVS